MKTAAQALAKWQRGTAGAVGDYQTGVQNSKDWAGATAQAVPTMVQNFNTAASSGRIANGINRTGTGGWRAKTLAKANNWQTGVQSAGPSYQTAYTQKLLPMLEAGQSAISGTPRGGIAQNLERARLFAQAVHDTKQNMG